MATSNLRSYYLVSLFLSVILLSACSSTATQPKYSADMKDFRFYILQTQQLDKVVKEGKDVKPKEGFVFLVVEIIIENITSEPKFATQFATRVSGRAAGNDYKYEGYYVDELQWNSLDLGLIPPGLRVKATKTFEVARTVSELRLEIEGYYGLFGHSSVAITLPPLGQVQPISVPNATGKMPHLVRLGESVPWFESTTLTIENLENRFPSRQLWVRVRINNVTGYAILSDRLYWDALIVTADGTGNVTNRNNTPYVQDIRSSIAPGQSAILTLPLNLRTSDQLKGGFLFLGSAWRGGDNAGYKWVLVDLSTVQ